MPKVIVEIEWYRPEDEDWLNADNVALALHAYCSNTKFKVRPFDDLSASEALYGFMGWLTTRPEQVVISSHDDVDVVVGLVAEFCKANGLADPRDGWGNSLVHPPGTEG